MKLDKLSILLSIFMFTSCSTILVNTTNRDGIQEDPTRRTSGALLEDRSIETKVAVNLKAEDIAFRNARFNVISHNGVVLIVGQIGSETLKLKATEVVLEASAKIKRIHNELEITNKAGLLSRGNDTWIATKVRTSMLVDTDVPADQIRVVVENSAVYLMGIISEAEGDMAANLARNVAGVARVVKVFDYI